MRKCPLLVLKFGLACDDIPLSHNELGRGEVAIEIHDISHISLNIMEDDLIEFFGSSGQYLLFYDTSHD